MVIVITTGGSSLVVTYHADANTSKFRPLVVTNDCSVQFRLPGHAQGLFESVSQARGVLCVNHFDYNIDASSKFKGIV